MARRTYISPRENTSIPKTTDSIIIFPYDNHQKQFRRIFYSPSLTDQKMSSQELDDFLREIEQLLHKKLNFINGMTMIFGAVMLIGFALFVFFQLSEEDKDRYFLILSSIGFFCLLALGIYFIHLYRYGSNQRLKHSIQKIVNQNQVDLSSRGLRWHLPILFPKWIELWKDYKTLSYDKHQFSTYNTAVDFERKENVNKQTSLSPTLINENISENIFEPLLQIK